MSYACPCCRNMTMTEEPPGTFEVCAVCYWEDDEVQFKNLDYEGGANTVSLRLARENYIRFRACSEEYVGHVRSPTPEEIPAA